MNILSQFWFNIQEGLFPYLKETLGQLTEKQQQLIVTLEMIRIEEFVRVYYRSVGRPPRSRQAIARAFVAKAVYNMGTTSMLIERLKSDINLRRICGWEKVSDIPDESTFSRAFTEFAGSELPGKVHEALIDKFESDRLVGHISRDSTEIEGREKPVCSRKAKEETPENTVEKPKRGRPKKGEERPAKEPTRLERQEKMELEEMLDDLPKQCDVGSKKNSKGYKETWQGYKLHIDSADGEIPISCILTSASVHDSQVALPLAEMTRGRIDNLYDLMDAAYDSEIIKKHSISLGHVPIIDPNPRGGEKLEMEPDRARRYNNRTTSERVNSRLKDDFGGRFVRVRGHAKVLAHLMFGILALAADQLFKLAT